MATDSGGAAELGIGNVGGVFVVLVLGCFCAFILGLVEFLWNIKAIAIDEKVSGVLAHAILRIIAIWRYIV